MGERESGTEHLDEAVAAYRAALEEQTRERVPLDWAKTQNDLGNALEALGERESGTAQLEEAVAAYRAALEERTRDRVPLQWAETQNRLANALEKIAQLESTGVLRRVKNWVLGLTGIQIAEALVGLIVFGWAITL